MKKRILPSILSADLGKLMPQLEELVNAGCEWLHVDVMDGHFVPNLTFGPGIIRTIKKYFPDIKIDAHLMVTNPDETVAWYMDAGADAITVHWEAATHHHRCIHQIKNSGKMGGVVLNPGTPASVLEAILPFVDLVLLMSVNPGFAAQQFIPEVLEKAKWLDHQRKKMSYNFIIEIDGGINLNTITDAHNAGVDWFVAGNAVFANPNQIREAYERLEGKLR